MCIRDRVDTEHILPYAESVYEIIPEDVTGRHADILLINTCGFIGDAKEESVNAILEAVERKKSGEVGEIVVFGCLSQRYAAELPGLIPEVDKWLGARDLDSVIKAIGGVPDRKMDTERRLTSASHYAYLKISEGCDRRCSYCAIPFILSLIHISEPTRPY